MANYCYWVKRYDDILANHIASFVIDPDYDKLVIKFLVYQDGFQIVQLVLHFDYNTDRYISSQLCLRWADGEHEHFNYRKHSWIYWLKSVGKRWLRWAKRKRAARVIRRFYYDYVIRKLYDPHREGKGFIKLKEDLIKMNAASAI